MSNTVLISDMIKEFRGYRIEWIKSLGYTDDQAVAFADGYESGLKDYSVSEKLYAIENMDDHCMSEGFKNAGIDEDEAFDKSQQSVQDEKAR